MDGLFNIARHIAMKRKRTSKAKKKLQHDATVVAEPETSKRQPPPLRKPVWVDKTEENITLLQSETETPRTGTMRGRQADLEIENTGPGSMEINANALGQMIATIIKEISKEPGGLANLSSSLVTNSINNGQTGRPHVNMDIEENESHLHQNPEFKKPELNAALAVIKKTMNLDAAVPFNKPVDPVALDIPDYFDVIDTPMDFGTICNDLENGLKYRNASDVFKDVQLIWYNCLKYNKKGDHVLELMKRVKTCFMKYWKAAGLDTKQAIVESSTLTHKNRCEDSPPTQQKVAGSNQTAENWPALVNMQVGQAHLSSSLPQVSPEQAEPHSDTPDSRNTQKKRQVRGPTRGLKLLNSVGRIKIVTNEMGQPVGSEATQLTSFLGLTARDGNVAPLTYPSWSKMPKENKENMWQKVLTKFDIDPSCRSWVLMSLRTKWRNFKFYLKATHYDPHATDEERLADRDERVLPDQWAFLVSQWSSHKWQSISAKNKAIRAKVKFSHTSGTKSFARILEEERAKRPDGQEPSQAELFILTRTHKNGQPVNEATAAVISQLRESTTQGDVSLSGLNAIPLLPGTKVPTRDEALRMVKAKNAEVVEMKERLASVEQTCSQMAAQMSTMLSMMANMQRDSPAEIFSNAGDYTMVPRVLTTQPEPISTSNHEVPAKQTRGRKKRR